MCPRYLLHNDQAQIGYKKYKRKLKFCFFYNQCFAAESEKVKKRENGWCKTYMLRNFLSWFEFKLFGLELLSDKSVESPLWDLTRTVHWELSRSTAPSYLTVQTPPIQFQQRSKRSICFCVLQLKSKISLGKVCERTERSECKVNT